MVDKVGPVAVGLTAMGCMLTAALLWPLAHGSLPAAVALILLWGSGGFALNGSQQIRLIAMAPPLASASVSLNSSAVYLGQALGAFLGGLILSAWGSGALSYFAAVPIVLAMAVSTLAASMVRRRREGEPACAS